MFDIDDSLKDSIAKLEKIHQSLKTCVDEHS